MKSTYKDRNIHKNKYVGQIKITWLQVFGFISYQEIIIVWSFYLIGPYENDRHIKMPAKTKVKIPNIHIHTQA